MKRVSWSQPKRKQSLREATLRLSSTTIVWKDVEIDVSSIRLSSQKFVEISSPTLIGQMERRSAPQTQNLESIGIILLEEPDQAPSKDKEERPPSDL